ncbi:hypothetical protein AB6A40_010254 [Gnathostoma spinigerum]|uniref:Uncharacterized protein n=1 Tax=Gnathostoma spinigerum TaxID=75299 RepID=A0ABD6EVM5_9BILA
MATRGRGRGRGRKRDTVVDTDVSIGGLASSMASMSLAPRPSSGPSRPTEVSTLRIPNLFQCGRDSS